MLSLLVRWVSSPRSGCYPHSAWEHEAPGAAQVPQLALQQTCPTLQVLIPQGRLTGIVGPPWQARASQAAPGAAQMPQLALQQTCPTLHVLGPQLTLVAVSGRPQTLLVHVPPGGTQRPQLSLQQT